MPNTRERQLGYIGIGELYKEYVQDDKDAGSTDDSIASLIELEDAAVISKTQSDYHIISSVAEQAKQSTKGGWTESSSSSPRFKCMLGR